MFYLQALDKTPRFVDFGFRLVQLADGGFAARYLFVERGKRGGKLCSFLGFGLPFGGAFLIVFKLAFGLGDAFAGIVEFVAHEVGSFAQTISALAVFFNLEQFIKRFLPHFRRLHEI